MSMAQSERIINHVFDSIVEVSKLSLFLNTLGLFIAVTAQAYKRSIFMCLTCAYFLVVLTPARFQRGRCQSVCFWYF